ncbi:hypothetical protein OPQ81_005140 [Rhizoctonia solani]|nr:hypothetical protein OPQ81_005140 [Rhizoctonia solani]
MAHMASTKPIMGITKITKALKPADRSTLGHRRSYLGHRGIPGAFTQSSVPQEPELSLDKQEEDWISGTITEAAKVRIDRVRGNPNELNPLEVSNEEDRETPTNPEPSEAMNTLAERQGNTCPT